MPVTHHALSTDMPEYKELIHRLKTSDARFARLLESYDELSHKIENIENGVTPTAEDVEHSLKTIRVRLKDELAAILESGKQECCGQCGGKC